VREKPSGDANSAWDRGEHLEAVEDGASAVGKLVEGTAEAAWDKITDIL
jgi:hypothetical protein